MAMKPTPGLVHGTDLTMVMDHSQFYVHGGGADSVYELVETALHGDKWASNGRSIVVVTPVEYNFDMPVRIEVWNAPPPVDLADWAIHITAELEVSSNMLQLESTSGEPRSTPIPNGHYFVEIAGRNFPSQLSPEQNEQWRIRLWPNPSNQPSNDHLAGACSDEHSASADETTELSEPPQSPPSQLHLKNSAQHP